MKERRRVWLFRLCQETLHSERTYFVTLTFDEEKLAPRLLKRDLQLIFKRLRKIYDFKYYAIGEFGSQFGRPHYHFVMFVKQKCDILTVEKDIKNVWNYGFVTITEATVRRLNYILHYHIRPKENNKYPDQRAFCLMSNGLGLQFINDKLLSNLQISSSNVVQDIEGRKINLPRYYRKKYDIPSKSESYKTREWNFLSEYARSHGKDEFELVREMHHMDKLLREKYNSKEL